MAFYKGAAKEANRAMQLSKRREKEQADLEQKRRKVIEENAVGSIADKFASNIESIEQLLKADTVGLLTLEEMKARQRDLLRERDRLIAIGKVQEGDAVWEAAARELAKKDRDKSTGSPAPSTSTDRSVVSLLEPATRKEPVLQKNKLSFAIEEPEEEDSGDAVGTGETEDEVKSFVKKEPEVNLQSTESCVKKRRRFGMCSEVDTSGLPDEEREAAEAREREALREEWTQRQTALRAERMAVVYSYWDGSGHRRQVEVRKGNSIGEFLQRALEQLRREFAELRAVAVDQLMYIKEDLIMPHHLTFYHLIVTRARGKSGPLFSFDVHEDVRALHDARVEKDESHAGKVCTRSWYERNKHIFPASRWEPYDPEKNWDKYTISDKNAPKITVK